MPTAPNRVNAAEPARIDDQAVRQTLIVVWEAADKICTKRLKQIIPVLVSSMERHGHLQLDPQVRARLLGMSAATMDRLLKAIREVSTNGRRRSESPSHGMAGRALSSSCDRFTCTAMAASRAPVSYSRARHTSNPSVPNTSSRWPLILPFQHGTGCTKFLELDSHQTGAL
jgi:hypothetical protein